MTGGLEQRGWGRISKLSSGHVWKESRQLCHIVETQWLSLGEALELIIEQWEVLAAYFQAEADKGGADAYAIRQLLAMYTPKNKVVIVFVSERISQLNHLNQAFQGEQPNQSSLMDHLHRFTTASSMK